MIWTIGCIAFVVLIASGLVLACCRVSGEISRREEYKAHKDRVTVERKI